MNSLCIYNVYETVFQGVLTVVPFHKSGHKCFARSGSLITNQIIKILIIKIYIKLINIYSNALFLCNMASNF